MLPRGTPVWAAIVLFKARASSLVGFSLASISISVSTTAKSNGVGTGVGRFCSGDVVGSKEKP
jgi:hypothetical protein